MTPWFWIAVFIHIDYTFTACSFSQNLHGISSPCMHHVAADFECYKFEAVFIVLQQNLNARSLQLEPSAYVMKVTQAHIRKYCKPAADSKC